MRFAPFALLALAALSLAARWESLPERWVVHWGRGGVPDGFASRTVGGVFGPLLIGVVVAVILEVVAVATERSALPHLPHLSRAYGAFVRWMSVALTGGISFLAIRLPAPHTPSLGVLLGGFLGLLALGLVMGAAGLRRAVRQMAEEGTSLPPGYGTFIYSNPDDPRLLVPKLVGKGWTFNFARPAAWVILAVILLPVVVALAGALFSASR